MYGKWNLQRKKMKFLGCEGTTKSVCRERGQMLEAGNQELNLNKKTLRM
jgi:hypothetical protein